MRNNMRNTTEISFNQITCSAYAFVWQAAEDGYKLVDESTHIAAEALMRGGGRGGKAKTIDECPPWLVDQGTMSRQYAPLSNPTLHRKLASLYSNESILKFANSYGLLGKSVALAPVGGGIISYGESIDRWREESANIGALLYIWDLVEHEDSAKLGQLIIWPNDRKHISIKMIRKYDNTQKKWLALPYFSDKPAEGLCLDTIAAPFQEPQLLERWVGYDLIEPAKFYVCREVNKQLREHVAPQILPFAKDKIYFFPDSLLSSLWVMFLMELTGTIRTRPCDTCQEWKVVSITRKDFYCSNACRQKAYYKRHKEGG